MSAVFLEALLWKGERRKALDVIERIWADPLHSGGPLPRHNLS